MDTSWQPVVHSYTHVEIPVVVATHSATAHQRWKDAQKPWRQSGYTDHAAFGRYSTLANTGRFRFPRGKQAAYKFGEFHAALLLHHRGFICWSAVHLFTYGKRGQYAEFSTRNTQEVRRYWSVSEWPSTIQKALAFQPRNPDIVAYHPSLKEWRFCEVKRPNDRIKVDQLRALAVLHLMTCAPVAIVRVVPSGGRTNWKSSVAVLDYPDDTLPSWIRKCPATDGAKSGGVRSRAES